MTRLRRPTLVVALHDGFYGCGTGAGCSNYALLQLLVDLLPTGVRLVVLPVHLDATSPEHNPIWHAEVTTLLACTDAVVHPVDNGTTGQVRFGGLTCFRHLVHHTADILTRCVLPSAAPVLILALDAPFLGLAPLLPTHVMPNLVLHLVLAAVTDNPEPGTYQQHLAKKITNKRLDVTLLTRFHPDIRRLLAHPALRGVVVPSRAEPFGRVPIEAYTAGATPVIATTAGGLTEHIINGHTGFTATPKDSASLANALRTALALSTAERHRIRESARQFATNRYDHPRAVRAFLKHVAPWLDRQPDGSQSI